MEAPSLSASARPRPPRARAQGAGPAWRLALQALILAGGLAVAAAAAPTAAPPPRAAARAPLPGATVHVSQSGACTRLAPPGAACATFKAAVRNQTATRLVLLEAVSLQQSEWPQETG
jgi:hypothetical protein